MVVSMEIFEVICMEIFEVMCMEMFEEILEVIHRKTPWGAGVRGRNIYTFLEKPGP